MSEQLKSVAQAFVTARRAGLALATYPGTRPEDLAAAYAIQDHAIRADGRPIAGWKVGRIFPPDDACLGANRLSGPIFTDSVVDGEAGAPAMPVFVGGFAAAEAEFLLHIAPGHAGATPQTDAETLALLNEVRIGIEIASSPYPGINADGPAVTASDFGNNFGLVLGPQVADWRGMDLRTVCVRTAIDGETVGEASAETMLDGPLGAVRFLLANLAERSISVEQGAWVSSGAVTGVHGVRAGQRVEASFGTFGKVACTIVAAPHS